MKRTVLRRLIDEKNKKEGDNLARLLFKSEPPASETSSNTQKLLFPSELIQDDESMAGVSNHMLQEGEEKRDDLLEQSRSALLDPRRKSQSG